jgi:hypothetical protein
VALEIHRGNPSKINDKNARWNFGELALAVPELIAFASLFIIVGIVDGVKWLTGRRTKIT